MSSVWQTFWSDLQIQVGRHRVSWTLLDFCCYLQELSWVCQFRIVIYKQFDRSFIFMCFLQHFERMNCFLLLFTINLRLESDLSVFTIVLKHVPSLWEPTLRAPAIWNRRPWGLHLLYVCRLVLRYCEAKACAMRIAGHELNEEPYCMFACWVAVSLGISCLSKWTA